MRRSPDWSGIVRHRKQAEAELAALGAMVEGGDGQLAMSLAGPGDDDKAPAEGEEQGWLERQRSRLESLRDRAQQKLEELGDRAKRGVGRVARGIERSAKRGLKAARSVFPSNDSLGEKVKKGFKGLIAWAAGMATTTLLFNAAIIYVAYKVLSDEKVQGAARAYYRR